METVKTPTVPGNLDRLWKALGIASTLLLVPFLAVIFTGDHLDLWLYDFDIYWQSGRSLLTGTSPYEIQGFYSPLPLAVMYVPFALLPQPIAYGIFVLLTLWMLWKAAGLRGGWALLSFPVVFTLFVGQVDLFLALATALFGPLALPLLLTKPQVAFVVAPWLLLHTDRRRLLLGIGATFGMLLLCYWLRPDWVAEWLASTPLLDDYARHDSNLYRLVPGSFRTTLIWILSPLALLLGIWLHERRDSWVVLYLCTPINNLYSIAVLAEWIGPLEVFLSWMALLAMGIEVHHGAPTFIMALAILARRRGEEKRI
jgi:hypothetical protein